MIENIYADLARDGDSELGSSSIILDCPVQTVIQVNT